MLTRHCIANCCAYCIRGNVVSPWRSFVTTELVSLLLRLKNRHGHKLWSLSTGKKDGLMRRTRTHGHWLCRMSTGWKNGSIWRTHTCEEHGHTGPGFARWRRVERTVQYKKNTHTGCAGCRRVERTVECEEQTRICVFFILNRSFNPSSSGTTRCPCRSFNTTW